ncbi:Photosystem I assembly protein Ycf3 [Candidatus Lokiarchaeum ossiferum]|uniref:Photosystem I assembly protein Ycf3 n=1 Tax=Candidatus Lokiarchaeum ossiferum TaxID=2951803 RepID=A0ABY6HZ03_9ARCH|nr:Photosystem I assembly protein Ycf3 [Candidatus Lokiarchaeum sp. B-35]
MLKNKFHELIKNKPLTFLAGAGCSVDNPSNLPAGSTMIRKIIRFTCALEETNKLLSLKDLRFEQLMDILREQLDPELHIIDYFSLNKSPNLQHFFLAQMIKLGHIVMTTNFDCLIEQALLESDIPKEKCRAIITRKDFKRYSNPSLLFQQGFFGVYKIHGSALNQFTKKSTRESLVATIQAFGQNKEERSVFQVEKFKKEFFTHVDDNRTLVVMGYSGYDDFDIVPTLKLLKDFNAIIWIEYQKHDNGQEIIENIQDIVPSPEDKIGKILYEIKQIGEIKEIYRIRANTSRLITEFFENKKKPRVKQYEIQNLDEWMESELPKPKKFKNYSIPFDIYNKLLFQEDALRCGEKILEIANKSQNLELKATTFNNVGLIFLNQGKYDEALKYFTNSLNFCNKLSSHKGKAARLNNIGLVYKMCGNIDKALEYYKDAFEIDIKIGDIKGKSNRLNNIGQILEIQGEIDEAISHYRKSLEIDNEMGDLHQKSIKLNNIGELLFKCGKWDEALEYNHEAFEIAEKLADLRGVARYLNNKANILLNKGILEDSFQYYQKSLNIAEKIGDIRLKSKILMNLGDYSEKKGNYVISEKYYKKSLDVVDKLKDPHLTASILIKMGELLKNRGIFDKSLAIFKEAWNKIEKSINIELKFSLLYQIGDVLHYQKELDMALQYFQNSLKFSNKMKNRSHSASVYNNIGLIYYKKKKDSDSLKYYNKALKISKEIGNIRLQSSVLNNFGTFYSAKGNYKEAFIHFQQALLIDEKLDQPKSKAELLNNMGIVLFRLGKKVESLVNLKNALDTLNNGNLENIGLANTIKKNINNILKNNQPFSN